MCALSAHCACAWKSRDREKKRIFRFYFLQSIVHSRLFFILFWVRALCTVVVRNGEVYVCAPSCAIEIGRSFFFIFCSFIRTHAETPNKKKKKKEEHDAREKERTNSITNELNTIFIPAAHASYAFGFVVFSFRSLRSLVRLAVN